MDGSSEGDTDSHQEEVQVGCNRSQQAQGEKFAEIRRKRNIFLGDAAARPFADKLFQSPNDVAEKVFLCTPISFFNRPMSPKTFLVHQDAFRGVFLEMPQNKNNRLRGKGQ